MSLAQIFRCALTCISPVLNTKVCYRVKFGKKLDLKNPQTFHEKLLWLKLRDYETNPLVRQCADKYRVREYVEQKGCGEILNPLFAAYDDPEEIRWDELPEKFALKWNFGCGLNVVCEDKNKLDREETVRKLKKWKNTKPYLSYSEMQYKNVKPVLLAEKYLSDGSGQFPLDYKFYCFNGKPYCVMLCVGRGNAHMKYYFFDRDWNFLRINKSGMEAPEGFTVPKPEGMDEAFRYAEILSAPFEFVRADFYIVDGKPVFGELTFTPAGAMDNNIPTSMDEDFGRRLTLPKA